MYTDFFLKFDNEAAADAVLFDGAGEDRHPKYAAIDVIGIIYKPTGKMITADEGEVPEMAPVAGWHVNVRHTSKVPELERYRVHPVTPQRMWA